MVIFRLASGGVGFLRWIFGRLGDGRVGVGKMFFVFSTLPSGYVKIAIEHGPFILDFSIKNGDFP